VGLLVLADAHELLVDRSTVEVLDPLLPVGLIVLEVLLEVALVELLEALGVKGPLEVLER
jgi:hypothetical protein